MWKKNCVRNKNIIILFEFENLKFVETNPEDLWVSDKYLTVSALFQYFGTF